MLLYSQLHTQRVFSPVLGWAFPCESPHQEEQNLQHTPLCSHNRTSIPACFSHCHAEMMALGTEPERGRDGGLPGKQHKTKGEAAPQSCQNVEACLENAGYVLPQPFLSTAACPMLWSAGNLLQVGGGLGFPLFRQQLTACLGVQGGPSHPGTQRVHQKVGEPGG